MEGTGGPVSGSVLTLLVREGSREGNRAILTHREGERSAASPQGPGTGKGITSLMSAQEVALTLEGWGKTKEMILLYSNSSILTVPRPNSGWLRLALGDFGLWLQLKSDLKVELRLVNTQRCI